MQCKKKNKKINDKSEIINEYIPQDQIKNLIQKDLSSKLKIKMILILNKLPHMDLLKTPTKKERNNLDKNEIHDPEFLEKFY